MDAFKDNFPGGGVADRTSVLSSNAPTTSTGRGIESNVTNVGDELRKIKSYVAGGSKSSPSGEEKSDATPENSDKQDFFNLIAAATTATTPAPSTSNGAAAQNGCDKIQKLNNNNNDCPAPFVDNKNMSKSFSLFEMHGHNFDYDQQQRTQEQQDQQEQDDVKKTLAFTIDFNTGRDVNTQRHRSMLERFEQQQRHRRGQSLVKFDEGRASPVTPNKPPLSGKLPRKKSANAPSDSSISSEQEVETTTTRPAPVRVRDRSAQSLRDSSKRHSWSPRSSLHEQALSQHHNNNNNIVTKPSSGSSNRFTPKSSVLSSTLDSSQRTYPSLDSSSNDTKSMGSFTCPEPPLENFKPDDEDNVSEAGTYTVEGDNYTEEQKERMNIDKQASSPGARSATPTSTKSKPKRPTGFKQDLEVIELDRMPITAPIPPRRGKNVLEVSCRYETSTAKPKVSYLDKLKSRVKNIGEKTFQKGKSPDKTLPSPDVGCFTSISTSGILSVQPSLEDKVQIPRRNSLSKATVDNSEYIHGVAKVNIADSDKVKLNVIAGESAGTPITSSDSPKTSTDDEGAHIIDKSTQVLKTASTKKDWIQEWARNAREYSTKAKSSSGGVMTRSYEFENSMRSPTRTTAHRSSVEPYQMHRSGYEYDNNEEILCDRSYPQYKPFVNNAIGDFEYSSDPNLRYKEYQNLRMKQLHYGSDQAMVKRDYVAGVLSPTRAKNAMLYGYDDVEPVSPTRHGGRSPCKPPVSPTKIPSPIHTMARPRSASTSRSNHASNTNLADDSDIHLQQTAAAITALQNLHRRNSLRNSSLQNSPKTSLSPVHRISPKTSPIHSLQSPVHLTDDDDLQHNQYSPARQRLSAQRSTPTPMRRNTAGMTPLGPGMMTDPNHLLRKMSGSETLDNLTRNVVVFSASNSSSGGSASKLHTARRPSVEFDQTYPYHRSYHRLGSGSGGGGVGLDDYDDDFEDEDDDDDVEYSDNVLIVEKGKVVAKPNTVPAKRKTTKAPPAPVRSTLAQMISAPTSSPIKRSSSFSVKTQATTAHMVMPVTPKLGRNKVNAPTRGVTRTGGVIQKSASSTSFKKMLHQYNDDDDIEFYINDNDALDPEIDYDDSDSSGCGVELEKEPPITNTRYNKAFLMRIEQSKKAIAGEKQGAAACPNTPEVGRRELRRDRMSMPRDSSLNRLKQDLHKKVAAGAKVTSSAAVEIPSKEIAAGNCSGSLSSNAAAGCGAGGKQKVLPKYLDISKYKSPQAASFLKKDESKSYLLNKTEVKRSPSSASVVLSRTDPSRASTRSVKSAGSRPGVVKKNDAAALAQKTKEQELEMWKRRAKYDPMKAAAEDKRKKEEARRLQQQDRMSKSGDSAVLRSQSFHGGVDPCLVNARSVGGQNQFGRNRWTLTSTESSDIDDDLTTNS